MRAGVVKFDGRELDPDEGRVADGEFEDEFAAWQGTYMFPSVFPLPNKLVESAEIK